MVDRRANVVIAAWAAACTATSDPPALPDADAGMDDALVEPEGSVVDGGEEVDAADVGDAGPTPPRLHGTVTALGLPVASALVSTLDRTVSAETDAHGDFALALAEPAFVRVEAAGHWSLLVRVDPAVPSTRLALFPDAVLTEMARVSGTEP